jgi:hypothetical protein
LSQASHNLFLQKYPSTVSFTAIENRGLISFFER